MNALTRSPSVIAAAAFAAFCALLTLVEVLWPAANAVQAQSRAIGAFEEAGLAARTIDAQARAHIAGRPLFTRDRKPPAAQVANAPASTDSSGPPPLPRLEAYRVVGLVIAGPQSLALVERPGGGQALRLAPGDGLDGWTVERVTQDGVIFVGQDERLVLAIPRGDAARQAASNDVTP